MSRIFDERWVVRRGGIIFADPIGDREASIRMADGVGFEPTDAFTSLVFKTSALNHSATHPQFRLARLLVSGQDVQGAR